VIRVEFSICARSGPNNPNLPADDFFVEEGDLDAARTLVATTMDAELFLYPGSAQLPRRRK
jgi:hypothetical protein